MNSSPQTALIAAAARKRALQRQVRELDVEMGRLAREALDGNRHESRSSLALARKCKHHAMTPHPLTITPQPSPRKAGDTVQLQAALPSTVTAPADPSWQWTITPNGSTTGTVIPGQESATCRHTIQEGTWTYSAKVTTSDQDFAVGSSGPWVATPTDPETPHPPIPWNSVFAVVSAGALLGLLFLFIWLGNLFNLTVSLGEDAAKADPRAALAARVIGPVLAIGAMLLLAGLWMVLLEWRGSFEASNAAAATQNKGPLDLVELTKVVAGLKGAQLIFVGGLVVILAVAWMVGATSDSGGDTSAAPSSAAPSSAAPSSATTASPGASTTPR